MKILGISAFYHDSAAALVEGGTVVFAAQEERFTRVKHDASFPSNAVRACLERGGRLLPGGRPLTPADLDAVVFYEKPLLKFERLLETYYSVAPRGVGQFQASMPVWVKEKLLFRKTLRRKLFEIGPLDSAGTRLLFPEHHLSHAASAFYPSPFEEAAILTVDGAGEWATGIIGHGRGRDIEVLREQRFPHSVGLLYSAFTYYTGFKVNSGEYKLMGLAPYGDPGSDSFRGMREKINSVLADVKPDGSIRLNQAYFDYAGGLKMVNEPRWQELFGLPPRRPESELTQAYCDMALAIQDFTEEIILRQAREAKRLTGSKNLCLAGGVALNCVANGRIAREGIFGGLWVQPAAGDAGGALGAALAAHHIYYGEPRRVPAGDRMLGAFLGPEYTEEETLKMVSGYGAVWERLDDGALYAKVAELLAGGAVVGWHQGRMEWGPRALGNRSILGDARSPEMQKKLNLKIKHRESFRPFAPAVLAEDAAVFFEKGVPSPYMLFTDYVAPDRRRPQPEGYRALPLKNKLYHLRSDIPAVTHLDYSARVQTVDAGTNPKFHRLLSEFKKLTGYGLLVNTSFNVRGEPVVCTPDDAYRCFMATGMDQLVIGNLLFDKKKQSAAGLPARKEYAPD
jgi:carbamoyltransferase